VILAAQARVINTDDERVVIATTNVKHLSRFVSAREWQDVEGGVGNPAHLHT